MILTWTWTRCWPPHCSCSLQVFHKVLSFWSLHALSWLSPCWATPESSLFREIRYEVGDENTVESTALKLFLKEDWQVVRKLVLNAGTMGRPIVCLKAEGQWIFDRLFFYGRSGLRYSIPHFNTILSTGSMPLGQGRSSWPEQALASIMLFLPPMQAITKVAVTKGSTPQLIWQSCLVAV
jgi:hypothetical protein